MLSKDAPKWLLHWAFEIQAMILGASRYTCHLELVENSSDVLLTLYIYTLSIVTDLKNNIKKNFVKNNFCIFGAMQILGIFIFKITQS